MAKVKPATMVLASVVAVGGGLMGYWGIRKLLTQNVTLSVTPTTGVVCQTWFTAKGRVTDGFGRGIPNVQVTLVSNEGTAVEHKIIIATGPDGSFSYSWRYGTGGQHIGTNITGAVQTLRAYTAKASSPIVRVTVDAPACTQCG